MEALHVFKVKNNVNATYWPPNFFQNSNLSRNISTEEESHNQDKYDNIQLPDKLTQYRLQ